MSTTLDYEQIKQELVVYLRNSDVYTTTIRSVTTATDTGFIAAGTVTNLPLANVAVKNVRTVTVNSVLLTMFVDYTVNYDYTANTCLIIFTTPQTIGHAYSIAYDHGTDKIFTDLPRTDLTITSFPRIGVDIIGDDSEDIEIGAASKNTTLSFGIYVYDFKVKDIDNTLTVIKNKMLAHQKLFYYQKYVTRIRTGPVMIFQDYGNKKIMFKSIDYLSRFNFEYA